MRKRFVLIGSILLFLILYLISSSTDAQLYNTPNQYDFNYMNYIYQNTNQSPLSLSSFSSSNYFLGDTPGYQDFSNFNSYFNTGYQASWLNHLPVINRGIQLPIVTKAGQGAFTYLWAIDPDNDMLFFSSNLGATGRDTQGRPIWEFTTNFPGVYSFDTMIYDQRGGYTAIRLPVYVKPWWSF